MVSQSEVVVQLLYIDQTLAYFYVPFFEYCISKASTNMKNTFVMEHVPALPWQRVINDIAPIMI